MGGDEMGWVKIDDGFYRNHKVASISNDARHLYLASICYASASMTDGVIRHSVLRLIGADANVTNTSECVDELVFNNLWHEHEDGYEIHDYLEHNTSAAQIRAKRESARERMQKSRSQEVRANILETSDEVLAPETEEETEAEADQKHVSVHERRFEKFWSVYPKKVGKGAARKWWQKHRPDDAFTDQMIAAVEVASRSKDWTKDNGQYIPNPATWLNQERWEDQISGVPAIHIVKPVEQMTEREKLEAEYKSYEQDWMKGYGMERVREMKRIKDAIKALDEAAS